MQAPLVEQLKKAREEAKAKPKRLPLAIQRAKDKAKGRTKNIFALARKPPSVPVPTPLLEKTPELAPDLKVAMDDHSEKQMAKGEFSRPPLPTKIKGLPNPIALVTKTTNKRAIDLSTGEKPDDHVQMALDEMPAQPPAIPVQTDVQVMDVDPSSDTQTLMTTANLMWLTLFVLASVMMAMRLRKQ
jgi:hypothetical protein